MHRRLLTLARDSRLALILTVLSGLLAGLLTIAQAWLLSSTVNAVFLEDQTLAQVWGWLRLILIIIAARGLLAWLNEVSANAVAVRIKSDLRQRLFNHILKLGPAYSRGQRTGELTNAAVEGIEALDAYFSQYLPQLAITALVPLSILLFVFPVDLLSAIVMLVTAPLIPFFMIMIGKGAEAVTKKQYETLSRLSAHFLDSLQGLTTLKLFGQSKSHTQNIAKVNDQFRDTTLGVLRITFLSAFALELLATLSTAIIAVEIGLRLLYAKMEFQEAFFLLILAPEFYLPLRMLGARFHAGMAGTSAARRIFEILDTPQENRDQRAESSQIAATHSLFSALYLSNLSYTYPGEPAPALQNINLQIHAGQHIALVGKSGAGKSTLVNLLLGFIQPDEGLLTVDGTLLTELDPDEWRKNIAWVPQKPHLFHDTLAANIRLARPEASEHEMLEAAKAAHLHEFIESLPEKYETVIGESGARLSGGQAQRLALARAFLKDASFLILDEPTSSNDPITESMLEESTRRLMQGRSVITIAHRLNTVFQADQIIVLDAGHIVEQGTHRELLARHGIYARMVKTNGIPYPKVHGQKPEVIDLRVSTFGIHPSTGHQSQIVNRKSKIFFRLLSFLRGSWNRVAFSILLSALTIGSSIALMGTSAWLISMAALHPSIAELGVSIVGVRFFGISRALFRYLERLVSHNVTFRLLARLRIWFYEKLEPLAPARLMEFKSGDLLARIISDVNMLENLYVRVIAPPLTALLIGAGVSFFFTFYDATLALVWIGFFLILGLILPLLARLLSRRAGQALIAQRANLNSQLVDGVQGLADLIAFGRAHDRARQIASTGKRYRDIQNQLARISGLHSGLVTLLTNLGLWTILFLAIVRINEGRIEGVMLGALALITLASFEAVMPLPLAAQMWESTRASAQRLFEIVDAKPAVKDRGWETGTESRKSEVTEYDLRITDLAFIYPSRTAPALQGITFRLEAGKSIAVVGPSGAGKSTLANLLLRFWDYESGEIRLAGVSLKAYAQDEIRKRIGVVTHNSYFFNTTVRENLRLARPAATMEEMRAAARGAQIHDFIESLPKGYDTFIGEQGLRLSGGERQRLAIARLLLKDAPIFILDEPTANLDPLTERQVLDTLFAAMRGKTTLLITHRLVGLENVDEILVMDGGQIVERGMHTDLLVLDKLYRRLWDLQNRILADA